MKTWKRSVADAIGSIANVHIIPRPQQWEWAESSFSSELLRRLDIDCVFDVGANSGQFAAELRKQGYQGTILSFEPAPAALAACRAAAQSDDRWHVFDYALGDEAGSIPFNILEESKLSSVLQPLAGDDAPFAGSNRIVETIDVEIVRLDKAFPQLQSTYKFKRPWLKLDTQGFDLRVASGAGACLAAFSGVLTEMGVKLLYEGSPTMVDSLTYFRDRGFSPIGFFSVHPGVMLDPHEFNCYLLRNDLSSIK